MSTLKVNTIQNAGGTLTRGSCWAWVNWDSTSLSPVANASVNVTSLTDNGVGDVTINLTSALANTSYAVVGSANSNSLTNAQYVVNVAGGGAGSTLNLKSTTQVRVLTGSGSSGALVDYKDMSVAIFGATP